MDVIYVIVVVFFIVFCIASGIVLYTTWIDYIKEKHWDNYDY